MTGYLIDNLEDFKRSIIGNIIVDVRFRRSDRSPDDPDYWEEILIELDNGYVIQFSSTFSDAFKNEYRKNHKSSSRLN
ncbi:MAG TPA: hypothetical protein GXX51_05500 [Firmicutes bacterium]|nr:hypothetical protein [Bacillota bacterium]